MATPGHWLVTVKSDALMSVTRVALWLCSRESWPHSVHERCLHEFEYGVSEQYGACSSLAAHVKATSSLSD